MELQRPPFTVVLPATQAKSRTFHRLDLLGVDDVADDGTVPLFRAPGDKSGVLRWGQYDVGSIRLTRVPAELSTVSLLIGRQDVKTLERRLGDLEEGVDLLRDFQGALPISALHHHLVEVEFSFDSDSADDPKPTVPEVHLELTYPQTSVDFQSRVTIVPRERKAALEGLRDRGRLQTPVDENGAERVEIEFRNTLYVSGGAASLACHLA